MTIIRQTRCDGCGQTADTEERRWSSENPEGWGEIYIENHSRDIDVMLDLCGECTKIAHLAVIEALQKLSS